MLRLFGYRLSLSRYINQKLKKNKYLRDFFNSQEFVVFFIFALFFFILFLRLFFVQIVHHKRYDDLLNRQHISQSLLEADRGNIYAYDKSKNELQLTDNISMYNVFVDPKFIGEKEKFIGIIVPVVYKHLCEIHSMDQLDKVDCIENLEIFAMKDLLPKAPDFFYMGSGIVSDGYYTFDWTGYYEQRENIITNFTTGVAENLIKNGLDKRIEVGIKDKNYIGFFSNKSFLEELEELDLSYITIKYDNYVYIDPDDVGNISRDSEPLKKLLKKYGYLQHYTDFDRNFVEQENRYVKILSNANPIVAQMVKDLKLEYYQERTLANIPILHGLGLESYTKRYYPYGNFLSNVLGYVDKNGESFYGIEQYFDDVLRGKDGKIIGRASAWIGNVGANEFEIEDVVNGDHVYLTIDIGIQKEIENIAKKWQESLRADSVSVLVYDPNNGYVKASINYPSFDPNSYDDVYTLQPLDVDHSYVIDNETYIDIPVYIKTGGETRLATTYERVDTSIKKYIAKNIYGPQVFVDKNISMAYEPGSIFKIFTVGVGIDTDEISFYDFYNDPGEVKVGPYTIKNADNKHCMGEHSFMNALIYSCNIGMVRIVQAVGKNNFYNYLSKLNFGQLTNIELAGEDEGSMESVTTVSLARYLNNSFGQGLLATPIQIAAAYGSLVNGGYYMKPTILAGIRDVDTNVYYENKAKMLRQIFRPETAEEIKEGLFSVMEKNPDYQNNIRIEGYTLGGKSGTSQISFKGKYQQGNGWTNGSFVGLITKEDPRYIVVIQVRRPRTSYWGAQTAGKVFGDVSKFLIGYSLMDK
ncbi:MAG TPA: penicillin-binding protein 2 [Candidatus Absconditabacterales bacterium]|nr:penicillin-binding protein 2 [Candidatus Absconditabacterales bacterium]